MGYYYFYIWQTCRLFGFLLFVLSPSLYSQSAWVRPDYSQVSEDVSVRIDVLANDYHFTQPIDSGTLHVVMEPSHGQTLIKLPSASIVYKPDPDFFGIDSFKYKVCNAERHCQEALVQIRVHAINDAPVAQNDLDTVYEDSWIRLDVIGNDSDLADNIRMENAPVKVVEMPRQGVLTVEQDGLTYRPNANYYGNDYFRYSICDESLCDTAMVRIHIKPVNDPPKVQDEIQSLRLHKSADEIRLISAAAELNQASFAEIRPMIRPLKVGQ